MWQGVACEIPFQHRQGLRLPRSRHRNPAGVRADSGGALMAYHKIDTYCRGCGQYAECSVYTDAFKTTYLCAECVETRVRMCPGCGDALIDNEECPFCEAFQIGGAA